MITVDEAMNHARNELERAFEKWLTDECPSGDCESVQDQWDDSFAHQELVDELQPVIVLTFEVHQLREQAANDSIQIELLEHKLESFREENERLKADAERGQFLVERGEWFRHNHDTPHAYALLAVRLPYSADLSCKAMREAAIDAARGAK